MLHRAYLLLALVAFAAACNEKKTCKSTSECPGGLFCQQGTCSVLLGEVDHTQEATGTTGTPGTTGNPCESYTPKGSSTSSTRGPAYGSGALSGQRAYLYRITVRVIGPRNTRSIVQSVIIL